MGKITDAIVLPAPVHEPNLDVIEEFLRKDTEEDKAVIYNYQPHIPQADDIPHFDNTGNTAGTKHGQDNELHINHKRNGSSIVSSDDDCYEDAGFKKSRYQ
jgi:hypothetical protein